MAAETKRELFSEEAIERVLTPERLDGYLRVVRPSAWIAVLALTLLVAGALIWAATGSFPHILSAKGIVGADGGIVSYLPVEEMPSDTLVGCDVRMTTADGTVFEGVVSAVSTQPLSQQEVTDDMPDTWTAYLLAPSPWEYRITIDSVADTPPGDAGALVDATIVVREERLLSFLMG
ncbi:MAG: hypothetical protein LBI64_00125 [Coriobacteriales bacterium]|jgi:hypothetical protein|nr:hypothetical protein [Coriobacteriales bacterium]